MKVDTQTRWIPRRPTEETPQLPTEPSALHMPAVSQPDPQLASPSVPVPVSTKSGRIVESSTPQMPDALQPDSQPASPSVPVPVSTPSHLKPVYHVTLYWDLNQTLGS